jgi:hypothetical protein
VLADALPLGVPLQHLHIRRTPEAIDQS